MRALLAIFIAPPDASLQSHQYAQQSCLANSIGTHQTNACLAGYAERQPAEDIICAEGFGQVGGSNQAHFYPLGLGKYTMCLLPTPLAIFDIMNERTGGENGW